MNYRLNKVSLHEFNIQRKRWVTTDSRVSYWHDEFHSMHTSPIDYSRQGRSGKHYGTSTKEHKASNGFLVNSWRGEVFGG